MESRTARQRKEAAINKKAQTLLQEQQLRARERLASAREKREDVDVRKYNALVMSLVPRVQAVVDSWCHKNVPMTVDFPAPRFRARTDFASIHIAIPEDEVSVEFTADLRGLAYHEAGHVRLTVPLMDLLTANLPSEVVDTDGIAHITPEPAWEWIKATWNLGVGEVRRAWNLLEDQRMETAMAQDSPTVGTYFNVIVLSHVIQNHLDLSNVWPFLIGRRHVDTDVRRSARHAMIDRHGLDLTLQAEALVRSYMTATTVHDLWAPVIPFALLLKAIRCSAGGDVDQHSDQYDPEPSDKALDDLADRILNGAIPVGEAVSIPEDDEADEGEGEGEGAGTPSDKPSKTEDAGGEGDGAGDDDDDDDDDDDEGGEGDGAGTGSGDPLRDRLNDALQRAIERRNADRHLTNDLRSYNEAYADTRSNTPLRMLLPQRSEDRGRFDQAVQVNRALRTMFEQTRAESAPSWQEGQRRGVLNVIRYKTRQHGDMEFFRQYAEGGDLHLPKLAISLILDGSGSMDNYDADLGMAAYAVKTACDIFSIPCTVTVYDTDAWLLWDAEDRARDMPMNFIPGGGTDPLQALDLIDSQDHGKDHHLVIIMTDGGWQGGWMDNDTRRSHSLADYRLPGRDIGVLFWNTPETRISGLETTSFHQRIDSLMEIPRIVRRFILAAL